jgi:hypothetical protein
MCLNRRYSQPYVVQLVLCFTSPRQEIVSSSDFLLDEGESAAETGFGCPGLSYCAPCPTRSYALPADFQVATSIQQDAGFACVDAVATALSKQQSLAQAAAAGGVCAPTLTTADFLVRAKVRTELSFGAEGPLYRELRDFTENRPLLALAFDNAIAAAETMGNTADYVGWANLNAANFGADTTTPEWAALLDELATQGKLWTPDARWRINQEVAKHVWTFHRTNHRSTAAEKAAFQTLGLAQRHLRDANQARNDVFADPINGKLFVDSRAKFRASAHVILSKLFKSPLATGWAIGITGELTELKIAVEQTGTVRLTDADAVGAYCAMQEAWSRLTITGVAHDFEKINGHAINYLQAAQKAANAALMASVRSVNSVVSPAGVPVFSRALTAGNDFSAIIAGIQARASQNWPDGKARCDCSKYHEADTLLKALGVVQSPAACGAIPFAHTVDAVHGQYAIGRMNDLTNNNYYACPEFRTLVVAQWTAALNDDIIGCAAANVDSGANAFNVAGKHGTEPKFPVRLVLGRQAMHEVDSYMPVWKTVIDSHGKPKQQLTLFCDRSYDEIVNTGHSLMYFPKVTHREVCILTLGLKMTMICPSSTTSKKIENLAPAPKAGLDPADVCFFTRQPVPTGFNAVTVEELSGISVNMADAHAMGSVSASRIRGQK